MSLILLCRKLKRREETKRNEKSLYSIQGVSGGIVNILGRGSMDYSE
jgi:hypothetical protein